MNGGMEILAKVDAANTQTEEITNHCREAPVVIVGAGPVGLLLALLLARKNVHSIVIEKGDGVDTSPRGLLHYPPVLEVFKTAGIYDTVVEHGFCMAGNSWRKPLADDGNGNNLLGERIAKLQTCELRTNGTYPEGQFCVGFVQSKLVALLLEEVNRTKLAQVLFDTTLVDIDQDAAGVNVTIESAGKPEVLRTQYLAGCDGGKSTVRKLLGIQFSGFSWPERLIATDVRRVVSSVDPNPAYFVVDPVHWGVVVPLEKITPGEPGLWRYAMAVADPSITDAAAEDDDYVEQLLLKYIDGPRPSTHTTVRKRVYRIHQLLASTMHRGRVVLAGDAAHLNNPIAGLGLCTGLLDVDILAQALHAILNEQYHDPQDLLAEYSAVRRYVFQTFVNPQSAANKLRLHENEPDRAAEEDWYFRALRRADPTEMMKIHGPLFVNWKTDLQRLMKTQPTPGHEVLLTSIEETADTVSSGAAVRSVGILAQ
ncbi:hypothetical protein PMZ80_001022 [Knufia obscura]|uniref:FAD-binding domain-containing protein n=1 Tax=Knufia obscura TaxID=1635080 RepID=A0ABR0S328_9EURO|nr:hypothetical protein PMZ80_001022 [Knufia obscura]